MLRPYSFRPKITPDRAAALVSALAPLAYFYPATLGRLALSPDDGVIFNIPLRVAAANIIRGGSLPLWNPYVFGGMPLHGAAQAGLLFPLNWFYLLLSPFAATNLMMLATYALAGLGAYLYARRAGSSIAGALLTGLVWQFSGFMVSQVGHTNVVQTAALLPWLLWAADGYGGLGGRWRGFALSALVALQVFAGHQQTLAYSLILVCAYALVSARASTERDARRRYLYALALVAAGLLLAAVQLVPTYELMRESLRAEASYDFFTSFSLPPAFLWTFFAPFVVGGGEGALFRAPYAGPAFYGEYVGYVGLVALTLAALAPVVRRDARTRFWAAAAVVGLLLATGRFLPFDLYRVFYYVPVINLFRVPARHLLEVDFALAVLAGRALTQLPRARERARARTSALAAAVCVAVFALALLAVTAGRPAWFRLGRKAPVTFLRAPELFVPVLFAGLSAWAVWRYARGARGARALLFAVVLFDLCLWGHSTGWRHSPGRDDELWRVPSTVSALREREGDDAQPYRVLTTSEPLAPASPSPTPAAFALELQPDTYMMHGVENAAGYDGFGLARYSRLASDMKLWGELPDTARTLRGEGREFDILNVRYLIAPTGAPPPPPRTDEKGAEAQAEPAPLPAPATYGGYAFADRDLGAPSLDHGERFVFRVPRVRADHVALVTNLSWSADVADGTEVGRVRLTADDGRSYEFALRAGEHTSEWAYDREDVRRRARHRRAPVATSYTVEDARGKYEGHTYVAGFALPSDVTVTGGEVSVATLDNAPDLELDVERLSLLDDGRAFPLSKESVRSAPSASASAAGPSGSAPSSSASAGERWRLAWEGERAALYENARALPRAWLVPQAVSLTDEAALQTVRTGRLPDGRAWSPEGVALVGPAQKFTRGQPGVKGGGEARVTRRGANRVDVSVASEASGVLVLSENFYPGWRVTVDGRDAELLRVDYNLRGVAVGPGRHEVSFVYRPRSVLLGLLISLLTLLALAAWTRQVGKGVTSDEPRRGHTARE